MQLSPPEPRPAPIGNAVQVQQIILNLIRNGLAAMLEEAHGDVIEVATAAVDAFVEVRVRDSGPGLSPAALERLFEPFFTTKPQGIGLGLSICKSIISAHGGSLTADAAPGGGAQFRVRLPTLRSP